MDYKLHESTSSLMITVSNLAKIHFPLKLVPRLQQIEGLTAVKSALNAGQKFVLLNMPTGTGKSYFANMFMNWYRNSVNPSATFDILTNSKILQEQYVRENPFIKNLKGKANYWCDKHDTDCEKGLEICRALKRPCEACPYKLAHQQWLESAVSLTNFHLFNTFAIYLPEMLATRGAQVLIVDEAHDFEAIFCDYISTTSSARYLRKYGYELHTIEEYDTKFQRIKTIGQYVSFIDNQFIPDTDELLGHLEGKLLHARGPQREELSRYINHCRLQLLRFRNLVTEYHTKPSNWVLDITTNESDKMYSGVMLEAKPVWGNDYLKAKVWDKYDHIIFMSGSILDREMFAYINGLEVEQTTYFEMDSPFPLSHRPIFYIKTGKMTMSQKEESFTNQLGVIKKILARNKQHKGIIHCGNYEFSKWLQEQLVDKRLLFHDADNREEKLTEHIAADYPSVIVSPSMISGVDLRDEISRFQIIMKIPYPYLGSNKIKQRKETNAHWYSWKTVMDFIQMYGRSVRSVEDWAETYVLDSSLSDMLKHNGKMIPRYISDAIKLLK